jgi:cytochrome b
MHRLSWGIITSCEGRFKVSPEESVAAVTFVVSFPPAATDAIMNAATTRRRGEYGIHG